MGDRRVVAVVVAYEPELDRLATVLAAASRETGRVIVVDNTPHPSTALSALVAAVPGAELLALGENRGIAGGLNAGVAAALAGDEPPEWICTLDQDTVLAPGAVETVLAAFASLASPEQRRVGVLALRHRPPGRPGRAWRWAERSIDLGGVGPFGDRLVVLTSGNLVRRELAASVPYDERLFMDQVDYAFCLAARRIGWSVLEYPEVLMDHRLGEEGAAGRYEPAPRLYYVVRNATRLLAGGGLPAGLYLAQLGGWARAYLRARGLRGVPTLAGAFGLGLADCVTGRMGRREYRLLAGHRGAPPA